MEKEKSIIENNEQQNEDIEKINASNKKKAIILITLSGFSFAVMSLMVKLAGDNVPSMQKAFFRNFVVTIVVLILFIKDRQKYHLEKPNIPVMLVRVLAGTAGIIFYYQSISMLDAIGDASLLNKLSPFFLLILSFIFLKEKLNFIQILAVVLAFIGAGIVIGPAFNGGAFPYMIGVLGALFASIAYLCVRILGNRKVPSRTTVISFSAGSTLILLVFLLIKGFEPMSLEETLYLLGAGVAAMFGQITLTNAYALAKAREISVFSYLQIIFAGVLGFIVLKQSIGLNSYIGYAIIIFSGILATKAKKEVKN